MKKLILVFLQLIIVMALNGQQSKTKNLIIVTLDGMRWQEVFNGVDEVLMNDSIYNRDQKGMNSKFWAPASEERRKKLFPFMCDMVANRGQLH